MSGPITIHVKGPDTQENCFEVKPTITVQRILEEMSVKCNTPVNNLGLEFDGMRCAEDETLASLGVQDGEELTVKNISYAGVPDDAPQLLRRKYLRTFAGCGSQRILEWRWRLTEAHSNESSSTDSSCDESDEFNESDESDDQPLLATSSPPLPTPPPANPIATIKRITIIVKGPDTQENSFEVKPTITVQRILKEVSAKCYTPVNSLVLEFDGMRCAEDETLASLGVQGGEELTVKNISYAGAHSGRGFGKMQDS